MKKKLFLLPITLTALVPIASVVGCNKEDENKEIPKQFLKITDGLLEGFDEYHQQEQDLDGYNTLVIPKDVTRIVSYSFCNLVDLEIEYTAPNVIKTITYENDCQFENFSCGEMNAYGRSNFCNLANLEAIYFPPSYTGEHDTKLFKNSKKVSLIDLSLCKKLDILRIDTWVDWKTIAPTGTVIFPSERTYYIDDLQDYFDTEGIGWTIEIKQ